MVHNRKSNNILTRALYIDHKQYLLILSRSLRSGILRRMSTSCRSTVILTLLGGSCRTNIRNFLFLLFNSSFWLICVRVRLAFESGIWRGLWGLYSFGAGGRLNEHSPLRTRVARFIFVVEHCCSQEAVGDQSVGRHVRFVAYRALVVIRFQQNGSHTCNSNTI